VIAHGDPSAPLAVVMLHGKQMQASDLAPFCSSLAVPAYFVVPDAPLPAQPRGRMWWAESDAAGPRELSAFDPPGRDAARAHLAAIVKPLARPVALVGFSQGGMLAMDYALHADAPPAALALLSSTRIAIDDWRPRAARLAGVPTLVAHGRQDAELAFAAGELLRDFAIDGGARVTWLPFDGGHEIPLVVWRALRKLLRDLA
jgi:phospholipase/carboxylesterase